MNKVFKVRLMTLDHLKKIGRYRPDTKHTNHHWPGFPSRMIEQLKEMEKKTFFAKKFEHEISECKIDGRRKKLIVISKTPLNEMPKIDQDELKSAMQNPKGGKWNVQINCWIIPIDWVVRVK